MRLPVHDYLDAQGIPYTTGSFPATTAKGAAEVARALGYAPRSNGQNAHFRGRYG